MQAVGGIGDDVPIRHWDRIRQSWRVSPRTVARPVVPAAPTVTLLVSCTTRATVSFSAEVVNGPTVMAPWSPAGVPSTMCTWPVVIGTGPADRVSTKSRRHRLRTASPTRMMTPDADRRLVTYPNAVECPALIVLLTYSFQFVIDVLSTECTVCLTGDSHA